MPFPPPQLLEIRQPSDVARARRAARALAEERGFDAIAAEEIALVMTELATNLIKHAEGGELTLTALAEGGRAGVEIVSRDDGPGIADVEHALGDRVSTSGTRGVGLGAVNRLMDELDLASERGRGTRLVCRRWVRPPRGRVRPCPLEFGVATRPRRAGEENGDSFVLKEWGESTLAGIMDGLGHGPLAHAAAEAARHYVERHFDRPLDEIFRGVGRACRGTRGVVMALARFDWGEERLTYASVGNIEARVLPGGEPCRFIIRRGVIGLNAPGAVVTTHPWPAGRSLVLHSDGLHTHWRWEDFPGLAEQPAAAMAGQLLRAQGKDDDDATVLVVRGLRP